MSSDEQKTTIRDLVQWSLAAGILSACVSITLTVGSTRKLIEKSNDLTSQQIAVTRSMHHVQELATAYLEGRRASQAAEESIAKPLDSDR